MTRLMKKAQHFLTKKEEGASLAEYGLLLALIAVAAIAAITLLGGEISNVFNYIQGQLSGVQSGSGTTTTP